MSRVESNNFIVKANKRKNTVFPSLELRLLHEIYRKTSTETSIKRSFLTQPKYRPTQLLEMEIYGYDANTA